MKKTVNFPKTVTIYKLLAFFSIIMLGAAYFAEYVMKIKPCLLCSTQRGVLFFILILSMIMIMLKLKNKSERIMGGILLFFGVLGTLLSLRLIYLESLPTHANNVCIPGLDYLLSTLSLSELLSSFILGRPDCGSIVHYFLFVPLSVWSLLSFIFICLVAFFEIARKRDLF